MISNIIINTVAPVLFAYGHYHGEENCKTKAIQWLEETPADNNTIVDGFHQLGVMIRTAYDSQACIELKKHYCESKKCLDCAIGNSLLQQKNKQGR